MIREPLFPPYGGIEIIVDERLGRRREQFRFPRSKKKRIRKKWRKRAANWRYVYDGPQMILVKKTRGILGIGWSGPFLWVNPEAKEIIDRELVLQEKVKEVGQRLTAKIEEDVWKAVAGSPAPDANAFTTCSSPAWDGKLVLPKHDILADLREARLRISDFTF